MALKKCVECGKEISSSAKICPHCGKRNPTISSLQKFITFILFCFIIFIVFKISSSDSNDITNKNLLLPPTVQNDFHNVNSDFPAKYSEASNEIQKSNVFNYCNNTRKSFAKKIGYQISDWVGKITSIKTDQGGDNAFIEIESNADNFKIEYRTYNNTLSDIGTGSVLKKGTYVYNQVGNLKEGDAVNFSGNFFEDSQRGILEASLTELGSIESPEFILRFTDIKKYSGNMLNDEEYETKGLEAGKEGDYDKAIEYFEKAVEINPQNFSALGNLGVAHFHKGEYTKAITLYKNALIIKPNYVTAMYNLASVNSKINHKDEALKWLKKAIDNGFNDFEQIKNDEDLSNIKNTIEYKKLIDNSSNSSQK